MCVCARFMHRFGMSSVPHTTHIHIDLLDNILRDCTDTYAKKAEYCAFFVSQFLLQQKADS